MDWVESSSRLTGESRGATVAVDAAEARTTFTLIPKDEVTTDYSKKPAADLEAKVTTAVFDVVAGQLTPVS